MEKQLPRMLSLKYAILLEKKLVYKQILYGYYTFDFDTPEAIAEESSSIRFI